MKEPINYNQQEYIKKRSFCHIIYVKAPPKSSIQLS